MVGALFVGGIEKIDPGSTPDVGVPARAAGPDRMAALAEAIDEWQPEVVLDLSDEPVLGYRERMELAAVALARGVRYAGADFELRPPVEGAPLDAPSLAVIGTGKRTGKTAISGELARLAARRGLDPVVVAMGRGGPPEPQVAEAGTVHLESPGRARAGRAARGFRLPRGCAHHRRHDDRCPAGRRRARRSPVRHERAGGGRTGRGSTGRA